MTPQQGAAKSIDGDATTQGWTKLDTESKWLATFDRGTNNYEVSSVRVQNSVNEPAAIEGALVIVAGAFCGALPAIGGGEWYQLNCPAGTWGSYVKIIPSGNPLSIHLAEIEVYSSKKPKKSSLK